MKRWIEKTVSFSCTACGKCCKSAKNRVYVNRRESMDLAALLDIGEEEFNKKYTFNVRDHRGRVLTSLKSDPTQQQCLFLKGNECSVYEARPTQCRTYPYWPQIMIGQAEWRAEAYNCEGVQIPPKQHADIDEVALNMIIHQIHDRGAGEDWTYDEARLLLEESLSENPNMIEDYLQGFYGETESRLVYESPLLRVVDCKVTQAAQPDSPQDDESDIKQHAYSRRMEFVQSAQLAQTEVYLQGRPTGWDAEGIDAHADMLGEVGGVGVSGAQQSELSIDPSRLHMPVHRMLASLCTDFIAQSRHDAANASRSASIAVIGAGCCALPSYLRAQAQLSNLVIHAVEPSAEVLDVAVRYFGANFASQKATGMVSSDAGDAGTGESRVIAHCMDGSQFLRSPSAGKQDVIIIDAFAEAEQEGGINENADQTAGWGLCAPPQALLRDWPQVHAALTTGTPVGAPGMLLMNVYGPASWADYVAHQVEESGLFNAPLRFQVAGQGVQGGETVHDAPGAMTANVVLAALPK